MHYAEKRFASFYAYTLTYWVNVTGELMYFAATDALELHNILS